MSVKVVFHGTIPTSRPRPYAAAVAAAASRKAGHRAPDHVYQPRRRMAWSVAGLAGGRVTATALPVPDGAARPGGRAFRARRGSTATTPVERPRPEERLSAR